MKVSDFIHPYSYVEFAHVVNVEGSYITVKFKDNEILDFWRADEDIRIGDIVAVRKSSKGREFFFKVYDILEQLTEIKALLKN